MASLRILRSSTPNRSIVFKSSVGGVRTATIYMMVAKIATCGLFHMLMHRDHSCSQQCFSAGLCREGSSTVHHGPHRHFEEALEACEVWTHSGSAGMPSFCSGTASVLCVRARCPCKTGIRRMRSGTQAQQASGSQLSCRTSLHSVS